MWGASEGGGGGGGGGGALCVHQCKCVCLRVKGEQGKR